MNDSIHEPSGLPISTIAAIHEYGWYGNPERDFMHQTDLNMRFDNLKKINKDVEEYMYYGGNIVSLYTTFGKMGVNMIKDTISAGNFVENSPTTIALKGSNKPLIDTGTLMNGAKYWVKKGEQVK